MTITLVKETHPDSNKVRWSVEKNGQFVEGTLTASEDAARRMYEAIKKSGGNSIWEKEVVDSANCITSSNHNIGLEI